MAKKKKKKDRRGKSKPPPRPASRVSAQLREAQDLARRGHWSQAVTLLETLDRQYPRQEDILRLRFDVALRINDVRTQQSVAEQLVALRPNDPTLLLLLADSYLRAARSALARRTYRAVLERWPDHPRAAEIRHNVVGIEEGFRAFLQRESPALLGPARPEGEIGTDGDEFQLAAWHEEVQLFLERGEYGKVRQTAEQLLRARPQFAPALNNMSEAYIREGNYDEALAATRRVLDFAPENVVALANLTRYLVLYGRLGEAEEAAKRLKAVSLDAPGADVRRNREYWVKVAEALSYLGDDAGVLATARASEAVTTPLKGGARAFLEHLAGVAAYRQGNEADARRHWETALRHDPAFEPAELNLADLKKPEGQRHAAWPFTIDVWLPRPVMDEMAQGLKKPPVS